MANNTFNYTIGYYFTLILNIFLLYYSHYCERTVVQFASEWVRETEKK